MHLTHIKRLFLKEIAVELRQQFAMGGIFLFAATVIFLIYKSFNTIDPRQWTIILWIVVLFAGINVAIKSFLQEKKETYLYYYTLIDPVDLALAKLLYNFLFLTLVCIASIFFLSIFSTFPVRNIALFVESSLLGLFGISIVFTFVSLIASTSSSNSTLMSILALPLVLPILLLLLKTSAVSARLITDTAVSTDLILLFGIDSMFLGVMLFLFPILWKS